MSAAVEDRNTQKKEGVSIPFPVVANDIVYGGTLAAVNAAGYLNPGSDTAGLILAGVAEQRGDNTGGAAGAIFIPVRRRGLFLFSMATPITQANVGDNVFLVDDQSVDLIANVANGIYAGVIAEYHSANQAWIDIEPAIKQADVATHLADVAGAHAASAISLADAGNLTASANLETLAAELLIRAPVAVADPGAAGAIPVTRSGQCAITTAGAETRTLAIPTFVGQRLTLSLDVDGGDAVITLASAINQAGNNTITMGDAGDTIDLVAVQVGGVRAWRVAANDGVALSTV